MSQRRKILIAGAGLGGLTAAGLLLQAGYDVDVYEQAPALGEVGAGIQVSANASRVLRHLGVQEALEEVAVRPERTEFRLFDTAEVISTIPLGKPHEDRFGAPYYHVYRPDLHSILANRVEELKPGAIHLNSTVASYTEDADGVVLTLASGERMQGDILVGADGIHSVVREQMHGKEKPKFTGNVAWRVMIPADKIPRDYQPL